MEQVNGVLIPFKVDLPVTRAGHLWTTSSKKLLQCAAASVLFRKRFDPALLKNVYDKLKTLIPTVSMFVNTTPGQIMGDFLSYDVSISLGNNTVLYARSHTAGALSFTDSQILDFFWLVYVNINKNGH